jgi:hypothetical protein
MANIVSRSSSAAVSHSLVRRSASKSLIAPWRAPSRWPYSEEWKRRRSYPVGSAHEDANGRAKSKNSTQLEVRQILEAFELEKEKTHNEGKTKKLDPFTVFVCILQGPTKSDGRASEAKHPLKRPTRTYCDVLREEVELVLGGSSEEGGG